MPVDLDSLRADPDFQRLSPAEQQQLLRQAQTSSPPASPSVAAQAAPGATSTSGRVDLDALRADPEFQALSAQEQQRLLATVPTPVVPRHGNPYLPPGVPSIQEQTLEEGITRPSTLLPLVTGGLGIKAVQGVLGQAAPWVGRFVRPVAEGLSQTLGFGTGRTIETGKLPSPSDLGTELLVTTATGRAFEDIGAIAQSILRRSRAGQAILTADDATKAAYAKWQADTQAAEQAAARQQKDLYDTALIKAKVSQREYEMATRQRQQTIAANQEEYETAVRSERESRYDARQREIAEQQADYQAKELARQQRIAQGQKEYSQAVTQQGEALQAARAVPARYTPETPSWVLYDKAGAVAKDTVVPGTGAKTALAELRAGRPLLPDGTVRPFPQAVEQIASTLERAGDQLSVDTIREELRRLGPLTRHADGQIRGPAKQLFGIYADALEAAPVANDLFKQANATFRREMAVRDMDDWLKVGHGVVAKDRFNRETINVKNLFNKLDKTVADDALFRGSFGPEELATLKQDFGRVAGTPPMPQRLPREPAPVPVPQPEYLPGSAPNVPQRVQQPPREPGAVPLPGNVRVQQVPQPTATPAPEPTTPQQVLGERPRYRPLGGSAGETGGLEYLAQSMGIKGGLVAGARAVQSGTQQARWLMAHALLDPRSRPLLQAAIDDTGTLNPKVYGYLLASLSPAERKAYERETGVQGR